MQRVGVNAATDITGFGLMGHLKSMVRGSGVAAEVNLAAIPVLPGARELLDNGVAPGGTHRNLSSVEDAVTWAESLTDNDRLLLCDAQTSGGLLMSVPSDRAPTLWWLRSGKRARPAPPSSAASPTGRRGLSSPPGSGFSSPTHTTERVIMSSNYPDWHEAERIIQQKDSEIAAGKAKIETQAQLIADQETVIAAQKALIGRMIEQIAYHGQRIKEFEEHMGLQEARADQLEQRAEELSQQVEWIRRRIFVLTDPQIPNDAIC